MKLGCYILNKISKSIFNKRLRHTFIDIKPEADFKLDFAKSTLKMLSGHGFANNSSLGGASSKDIKFENNDFIQPPMGEFSPFGRGASPDDLFAELDPADQINPEDSFNNNKSKKKIPVQAKTTNSIVSPSKFRNEAAKGNTSRVKPASNLKAGSTVMKTTDDSRNTKKGLNTAPSEVISEDQEKSKLLNEKPTMKKPEPKTAPQKKQEPLQKPKPTTSKAPPQTDKNQLSKPKKK